MAISMIGDSGHGKCCVDQSVHNGMKHGGYSHKAYALIGDLDSLQVGSSGEGSSTY